MAVRSIPLVAPDAVLASETFTSNDLGGSGDWNVIHRKLRGGLREGVETIEINNGRASFTIVPTRGMGLWKAKIGELEFGWQSPIAGPVNPALVDLGEPSGLGWLDGFDELLVRCGLESNGAPEFDEKTGRLKYPLHGKIANIPAGNTSIGYDPDTREISVCGTVEESRFHFRRLRLTTTYITRIGEGTLRVIDEIENLGGSATEAQLLYHVNFGAPLLDAGARVVIPHKTIVPRTAKAAAAVKSWDSYSAPQPGFEEEVYFCELHADEAGRTHVLLKNAHGTAGAGLRYNVKQLPCFTIWKDTGALADGYVTGLEPATNFPNPRTFEGSQNRVVKLAPGAKLTCELALDLHIAAPEITAAEKAIAALAAGKPQTIADSPQSGWCGP